MTHVEHTRFAANPLAAEHGQAPFHNDADAVPPGPLAGEAGDSANWESAWIDIGGEG
jgi:hypothetical protein